MIKPEYEKSAVIIIAPKTSYPNATTFKELDADVDISDNIDFECNSYSEEVLRNAGALDLWFKPVYKEPEFEFGRWYKGKNGGLAFITDAYSGYALN